MKDLDFDELDRAVNSLMTNVPKTPEPKKTDENEQTLTITPTLKEDTAPSFKTLDKTVAQINSTSPDETPSVKPVNTPPAEVADKASAQPLASRRGRFMDMVRPNTAPRVSETTRPPSRLGTTIEPTGPLLSDVVPSSSPMTVPKKTIPSDANKSEGEWPDPIEMTSLEDTTKEDSSVANTMSVSDETKDVAVADSYTPLTTPFLADTKVEKRPLGGVVTEEDVSEPVEQSTPTDEQKNADEAAQLPADPTDIAPLQLPEELSGDLVALEADANTTAVQPEPVMPVSTVSEQKSVDPVTTTTNTNQSPAASVVPDPEEKLLPPGPISIPQQYREEPSTGDKQSGSIYDTDTYHQPLSHPAKKKSGWMWVIWIIAILIIGAGCGAALYFMNIL